MQQRTLDVSSEGFKQFCPDKVLMGGVRRGAVTSQKVYLQNNSLTNR